MLTSGGKYFNIAFIIAFSFVMLFHNNIEYLSFYSEYPEKFENNEDKTPQPIFDFESIAIPIKRAGRLILVEAKIDSIYGNLILDTGAPYLVLNQTYFRNYKTAGNYVASGVTSSDSDVSRTRIDMLNVSGVVFENVDADLTNLGHIENRRGVKVLGLLGVELLKKLELVIDLKENILYLNKLDKKGKRIANDYHACSADISEKIKVFNNSILTQAKIADRRLSFCLDTGAETNILSNHLNNKILNQVEIFKRSKLVGSGNSVNEVLYGRLQKMVYSGKEFEKMNVLVTDISQLSEVYGFSIDGMLGFDFLSKGVVSINLKKKELKICFYKN